MARKYTLDDVVTQFLLYTCRMRPQLNRLDVRAALHCCEIVADVEKIYENADWKNIPLTTGSLTEFYIEPMLSPFGDIDIMYHQDNKLAIPRRHPPPTRLPAEFNNYVQVAEIIDRIPGITDSHMPGYVYLELRYILTQRIDDDKYNAVEYDRGHYLAHSFPFKNTARDLSHHGPAICRHSEYPTELSRDSVACIRCLLWLPQAADWPTHHRNYGWPDSATVDRVVSNGCDVVQVAHRQCRQHEWMGKYQWRLSFSRAEIVLINSWMPIQQIVYHMLRYFVKTERLTECADNSGAVTLSNYHIKTLMLWACELKPRSWWTDDVNLVRTCVQLLHILAKWLIDGRVQHYFINSCNLIDNSFNVTNIRDQLMSIDETWLSTSFVDSYIRKCLQLTPHHVSQLFDDLSTSLKLQKAVSAVVAWRQNYTLLDMWETFNFAEFVMTKFVNKHSLTVPSCVCHMTELAKIDSRLHVYFTAVAFLHVAHKSQRSALNDELLDVLATLCGQFISRRRYSNNSTSRLLLGKAVELMKVVVNKSLSTMSLIEIELSKAYLYRALRCKDSDSDSIYCLANVYLAILNYTMGQPQTSIDHCTLVTRLQDHSQCSSHVVQPEIFPKIDDDVDNMLGLAELYQSVRTAALKQQRQPQLVSVFTTELFAHYLSVTKCHQLMQTSLTDELIRYGNCIRDSDWLFIGDVLLFLSISLRQLLKCRKPGSPKPYCTFKTTNKYYSSDLSDLLPKSAVEHLTTYRELMVRDLGSLVTTVTTDFEVLYAYKSGEYQWCLQLSTQNVHRLLYARCLCSVPMLPQFIQLLDDDFVSLTALMLMVNSKCRDVNIYTCITQLILSLYLMTQCQLKLHHSVTSLVQTLDYIEIAQRRYPAYRTLDQLTLKLIKRNIMIQICTLV